MDEKKIIENYKKRIQKQNDRIRLITGLRN